MNGVGSLYIEIPSGAKLLITLLRKLCVGRSTSNDIFFAGFKWT